jgi:glycerol-3-phosphate dehydrogenase
MQSQKIFDLLVIGGGINGSGIAADAAGRGLSVVLCEQNDLGSGTSSLSTKLIHGGLRYLEQHDFKLVHEALNEREILLRKAPHLISPLRFIIPYEPGLRPRWLIRLGLWLYDHLGKRMSLPASKSVDLLPNTPFGAPLILNNPHGFAFTDCWVDDARLVIANALAAAELGAEILPRTQVIDLHVNKGIWEIQILDKITGQQSILKARTLINATGPWIQSFIQSQPLLTLKHPIRLVRGSHLIVPKRYEGDHAYLIQHADGRIVFVIPYEQDFTLIGTTEVDTPHSPEEAKITQEEIDYLIRLFNPHFHHKITRNDIIWHYSGVRPLIDSAAGASTELSREYHLELQQVEGAPILSVYGGKLTTYRTLAQRAVNQIVAFFPGHYPAWTGSAPLPGGDLPEGNFHDFLNGLNRQYPWVPPSMRERLARQYGTRIHRVLEGATSLADLGEYFGADCYEQELRYLIKDEWAQTLDDLLYRRTKLGLHLNSEEKMKISDWLDRQF